MNSSVLISLFFFFLPFGMIGQSVENPTKVYLLGTFHFAQTGDEYDIRSKEHQESIQELVGHLTAIQPNKIFVERQAEYEFQNRVDSLYQAYRKTDRLPGKNEIFELGFRTAKKMNHNQVYQCDHPGRYGYLLQEAVEYAEKNGQQAILDLEAPGTIERLDNLINEDSIMQNETLLNYIRFLNSDQVMQSSHAYYVSNLPQLGSTDYYNYDDDFTLLGAEVVADWYRRNIMIYTKIINQVDESDAVILLIIGGDHVPILNQLFQDNPFFQVVHPKLWLEE